MAAQQIQSAVVDIESSGVVVTRDAARLDEVRLADTQAVIVTPGGRSDWEFGLAAAVERGAFRIPRKVLSIRHAEEAAHVLEAGLSSDGIDFETRVALVDDIADLAARLERLSRRAGIMLRIFTEAPTELCGFHLDTVGPRLPPFGLLKVYNGEGTRYVLAADVTAMSAFYAYLGRREGLSAKWRAACVAGQAMEAERWRGEMCALDRSLPFLRQGSVVRQVPAGAIVAFRHLDVREHWSAHPVGRAWLHCSPMSGVPRLVVNLTPLGGGAARPD